MILASCLSKSANRIQRYFALYLRRNALEMALSWGFLKGLPNINHENQTRCDQITDSISTNSSSLIYEIHFKISMHSCNMTKACKIESSAQSRATIKNITVEQLQLQYTTQRSEKTARSISSPCIFSSFLHFVKGFDDSCSWFKWLTDFLQKCCGCAIFEKTKCTLTQTMLKTSFHST